MLNTGIIDLGDVLVGAEVGLEFRFARVWGISPDRAKKCLDLRPDNDIFLGRVTEEQYWRTITTKFGLPYELERLKAEMRANFEEVPGTRKILEALRKKGFRLGLLSVHGLEWVQYCEGRHGYRPLFHAVHYSYEKKVSKPDPQAWRLILEELGVKPQECFCIDDKLRNTNEARNAGLHGIVFRGAARLERELRKLGIDLDDSQARGL